MARVSFAYLPKRKKIVYCGAVVGHKYRMAMSTNGAFINKVFFSKSQIYPQNLYPLRHSIFLPCFRCLLYWLDSSRLALIIDTVFLAGRFGTSSTFSLYSFHTWSASSDADKSQTD